MPAHLRPLRITVQVAAALGLLSITLSGEISPPWCAISWTAWVFGLAADRFPQFQARLRSLETAAVAGMVGTLLIDFFAFHNSIFIAVTHFLLLFQIVKLAGEKKRKDCLQIFVFSFFQVLAACTLSVDPWHAAVLLALIPTATAALFWNQMAREYEMAKNDLDAAVSRNYRRMAALMSAAALPLNLVLTVAVFVIIPRLTLNVPVAGFSGNQMGYIDQINLSQKGNLAENAAVVLWLSFPRPAERPTWNGYLRGDVLSDFNGHSWTPSQGRHSRILLPDLNNIFSMGELRRSVRTLRQSITLVDISAGTLFTIGRPLRVVAPLQALQEFEGGSLHWLAARRQPLHYDVLSEPFSIDEVRAEYLALPPVPLDRIRALTNKVAGRGPPLERARRIEQFLQKNYRYSTHLGDRIPDNPVESFLFERRQGPCGHFASAMALMLRLQNIPCRLVAGYLKGEWNEPAQAVVIRERDAHAWVEAYVAGQGWISFDPSPRLVGAEAAGGTSLFHRLNQYSDYFGLLWDRFVIHYDLYSQIRAFESLKGGSGRLGAQLASWWSKMRLQFHHTRQPSREPAETGGAATARRPWKEIGAFLILSLVSGLVLTRRRLAAYDAGLRFYTRFLEGMARIGCSKHPWETGQEFAARLAQTRPDQADQAHRITNQYYRARFSNKKPVLEE